MECVSSACAAAIALHLCNISACLASSNRQLCGDPEKRTELLTALYTRLTAMTFLKARCAYVLVRSVISSLILLFSQSSPCDSLSFGPWSRLRLMLQRLTRLDSCWWIRAASSAFFWLLFVLTLSHAVPLLAGCRVTILRSTRRQPAPLAGLVRRSTSTTPVRVLIVSEAAMAGLLDFRQLSALSVCALLLSLPCLPALRLLHTPPHQPRSLSAHTD